MYTLSALPQRGHTARTATPRTASHRYSKPGKAGLLDRAFLFASLGNLAGSLCAHLVTEKPCELLSVCCTPAELYC